MEQEAFQHTLDMFRHDQSFNRIVKEITKCLKGHFLPGYDDERRDAERRLEGMLLRGKNGH